MVSGLSRRGQAASGAAVLIAIIAGFLVLYILFLPPAEREALLFGDGGGGGYGGNGGYGGGTYVQRGPIVLLSEVPGTLRLLKQPFREHAVPSATIFTRVNTEVVKSIDSGIVKNGVFARQDLEIPFRSDPRGSSNYLLSFTVAQAGHAPLTVSINDRQVYERPIREPSPAPIPIPVDYLHQGANVITLRTQDTGLAFWRPNAYVLGNVQVTADIIDTSGAVSEQTFSITPEEMNAFEEARLEFVPECDPSKAGRLTVHLNSRTVTDRSNQTLEVPNIVYTGFVDCGVKFRTDIPRSALKTGENRLLFVSEAGQYVVSNIKLLVRLQEQEYPVYYFNLPPEAFDVLDLGQAQLVLTMQFSDYRTEKRGEIVMNGFVQSFQAQDVGWQAVIDPAILMPGPNTVQAIPHIDRLDIAELRIEIV